MACEDDGNKLGQVSKSDSYQWIEVKTSQKGKKLQLEFKNSESNTYIFHKE